MKTVAMQCHETECPVQWGTLPDEPAPQAIPAMPTAPADAVRAALGPRRLAGLVLFLVRPEPSDGPDRTGGNYPRWLVAAKLAVWWAVALGTALALGRLH